MALEIERSTIGALAPLIERKKISPVDLTEFYLERIRQLNPQLNAYVLVAEKQARADAAAARKEIEAGRYRGALHGIPFSIKDNLATHGMRTAAGSPILADWIPDFDATAVERLKQAGAILLGKTNMHEWALGGTTINPFFGTTRNPWDTERIAGGSSGGSAAAVAADLCLGSLGTDSAQSVRNPASMCGVVGLKPTYGRVSQYGTVAGTGAFSCNHTGVLAKSVEDCSLILQAIAGHDSHDPLSSSEPIANYSASAGKEVKGLKAGILRGYFDEFIATEIKESFAAAVDTLKSLGMKVEDATIPHMDLIPAIKVATSRVENAAAHEPYLRSRSKDYSRQTLFSYISALLTPAPTYIQAQRARRIVCDEFNTLLQGFDVLVLPTIPFTVPTIEDCRQGYVEIDGKKIRRQDERGGLESLCCIPFNVTGLPAISVRCGFSKAGTPIGLQIAARAFREDLLFQVAAAYERKTSWSEARPKLAV